MSLTMQLFPNIPAKGFLMRLDGTLLNMRIKSMMRHIEKVKANRGNKQVYFHFLQMLEYTRQDLTYDSSFLNVSTIHVIWSLFNQIEEQYISHMDNSELDNIYSLLHEIIQLLIS